MPEKPTADFSLSAYSYNLPAERIAQQPAERRDQSRLLIVNRRDGSREHRQFSDILDYLHPGDLLVVNDTKVFPARLFGHKETGGRVEIFLLEYPQQIPQKAGETENNFTAKALLRASKRPKEGSVISINSGTANPLATPLICKIIELLADGKARLQFTSENAVTLAAAIENAGHIPLPPYISREKSKKGAAENDRLRYQTVYAQKTGAVAAPTAGLHFTEKLLAAIKEKGVETASVTLHVGYGTFAPVREEDIRRHKIHREYLTLSQECAEQINSTKKKGGRIWAVGTTTVRSLEFAARQSKGDELEEFSGWCDLYIYPGFHFCVVDTLITNFHLPNSSLMFLVAAFCGQKGLDGREMLLESYREAVALEYRFFSYGDAMAVI